MIIEASVRAEAAAQVILVSRTMPAIAAAAGLQLHLRAGRAVEVGGLVRDVDLELLDALHGRRHHASWAASCGGGSGGKAGSVGVHGAVHVAAFVASIAREGLLVRNISADRPVPRDAGLQRQQAGDVA